MRVINIENGITGYAYVLDHVRVYGDERSPRGIKTLDAGPTCVVFENINYSLPLHTGRNINRKIAAAEAIQLIGGFSAPKLLLNASKNFAQFMEPGTEKFHGAYGTRIDHQLLSVEKKLKSDADSRQAIITLWDPQLDNEPGKRDYPCTIALHFALINDKLEMTTTMRSQDVWLGAPFDWFQFTQLQQTLAKSLRVASGIYRHITLSTHIYLHNIDASYQLTSGGDKSTWEEQPIGIGLPGEDIVDIMQVARRIVDVNQRTTRKYRSLSERWYHDTLAPILD